MAQDDGHYGVFLIMGNAGFASSTVALPFCEPWTPPKFGRERAEDKA